MEPTPSRTTLHCDFYQPDLLNQQREEAVKEALGHHLEVAPRRGLVLHCADAKLSRTRLHRPGGGAFLRSPARGSSPTPAPPPHCGAAATATRLPRPAAGAGRSRARRPPSTPFRLASAGACAPRAGTLPTRAPLPGPPAPRTPKPQVAAGRSRRRAPRRGPRSPLGPAGGLRGPPPPRGASRPGGGAGRGAGPGSCQAAIFCRGHGAPRPPAPPPPLPLPSRRPILGPVRTPQRTAAGPGRAPGRGQSPEGGGGGALRQRASGGAQAGGGPPRHSPRAELRGPSRAPHRLAAPSRPPALPAPGPQAVLVTVWPGGSGGPARPAAAAPRPGSSSARAAARAASRPARCLPRSLPPSLSRSLSPPPPPGPPRPPLLSAFLLPSLRPPAAQASARRSPPVAALAPAPALRSRPGGNTGGPGAPRRERPEPRAVLAPPAGGAGSGPRRAPAAALRAGHLAGAAIPAAPCPSGGPPAATSPPCGAPLPGAASALGPRIQHWSQGQLPLLSRAGVKCLPPLPPAEPPAAFALQFSRPPPEPTALSLRASALGLGTAAPAQPRRHPQPGAAVARRLHTAKVGAPGASRPS
ncbi:basic proline-rich protein-like [Mus pahari]|uniref:basic proline-rich protein-like n=1 Tax=Mus pahari TaxID=10093 RepID=UPI000A30EE31|nr:basic proline-rich protein-like [Mus pahari]